MARVARETLEQETGQPVITSKNALDFSRLITEVLQQTEDNEEE